MQTPAGVTIADYQAALLADPKVSTKVEILTDDHQPVDEITGSSLTGQVNWLAPDAEVSRTLTLDVVDPAYELRMDSDSPSSGAVYADRFVRITQTVESPLLAVPASVRAFTGPLVAFRRAGVVVALEAQGKEQRARTDVPTLVCKKGMRTVDAIEKIMRQRCGETRFAFPSNVTDKLTKDISVGRVEERWPWPVCLRLAASIGMQLYYDGRGFLVLRDPPEGAPFHIFTPTGDVSKSHDWSQMYNRVVVHYSRRRKSKGKKKATTVKDDVVVTLGDLYPNHPFAPARMGRNGVPWTRTLFVEDDKINTRAKAADIARKRLRRAALQHLQMSAPVVPAWHLDPLDPVKLDGDRFLLREASAPIGTDGDMTLGYLENVRRPHR